MHKVKDKNITWWGRKKLCQRVAQPQYSFMLGQRSKEIHYLWWLPLILYLIIEESTSFRMLNFINVPLPCLIFNGHKMARGKGKHKDLSWVPSEKSDTSCHLWQLVVYARKWYKTIPVYVRLYNMVTGGQHKRCLQPNLSLLQCNSLLA